MAAVQEADSLLLKDGHGDLTPSKRRHRISLQHIWHVERTGIPAWAAIELSRATRGCSVVETVECRVRTSKLWGAFPADMGARKILK